MRDTLRQALGEASFDAVWEEGCVMTLEQVVAYALRDRHGPTV